MQLSRRLGCLVTTTSTFSFTCELSQIVLVAICPGRLANVTSCNGFWKAGEKAKARIEENRMPGPGDHEYLRD